jgi:D-3-phosphoglycerate dehydrogenase
MEKEEVNMRIIVTTTSFMDPANDKAIDLLKGFADDIVLNPYGRPMTSSEVNDLAKGADGIIAGLDSYDKGFFKNASDTLKVISRYGVGYDRVEIKAAKLRGIRVTNTPGVNSQSVADLAFGLMLSVARNIPVSNYSVKSGEWPRFKGTQIYGKTLGILGLGSIGKAVAFRGKGFSMRVIAHDPYIDEGFCSENGIEPLSLDEVLSRSDILSLHLPLTDATRGLIGPQQIKLMKPGCILVNTSRGGIIDESALYEALASKKIAGYGADAFDKEPPKESPLLRLDNVVATPHSGSHTIEAIRDMALMSVENLIHVMKDEPCDNRIC